MKKHNIIVALLFTLLAGMTSCGDNFDVSDKYNGVLSFSTPGYSLVETYNVGDSHPEKIYFQRGGLNFTPSTINLYIDESLVDSMNIAAGTNYKLMPQEYYTIENTSIKIDNEERLIEGAITVDPTKLLELNGGKYGILDYVVPIRISTEGMQVVSDKNTLILGFSVDNVTAVETSHTLHMQ